MLLDGKITIVKMTIVLKAIDRFKAVSINISMDFFFTKLEQIRLKIE